MRFRHRDATKKAAQNPVTVPNMPIVNLKMLIAVGLFQINGPFRCSPAACFLQ
jgi:hypothetical protein